MEFWKVKIVTIFQADKIKTKSTDPGSYIIYFFFSEICVRNQSGPEFIWKWMVLLSNNNKGRATNHFRFLNLWIRA